ncbi:aminopeptidase [Cylindrobasidium torrendii FP15055 ss-10]|uniref:Peptide hydrolase n=1 Tax=Cylindrobasidium torrendii FP15055 ss-10 TaxID=1314674 RepID=A0A0D7AXZ2_9AGAR|nr:aminopeptidase [Cylindrobasidium torrendii FP15055 ss-10]
MKLFAIVSSLAAIAQAAYSIADIKEKAAEGLRLLRTSPDSEVWATEAEVFEFLRNHTRFIDVTESSQIERPALKAASRAAAAFPSAASQQAVVNPIIKTLSTDKMSANLKTLGDFNNRYYKSSTGVAASAWIANTVKNITQAASYTNITVKQFSHSFAQSSVIARIPGKSDGPVLIVGGHLDSININTRDASTARAPGQDDNGSGSVSLIELFRVLVEAKYVPKTPVEFMWYAGEELGLLGSQDIAAQYSANGVKVQAVMNFDMTGYTKPGTTEVIALFTGDTNTDLTKFVKLLVGEYLTIGWVDSDCGYGCSDHVSWADEGYPTVFPSEVYGKHNPNIHSQSDTTSTNGFSINHARQFSALGAAFIVELTS